MAVVPRTAVMDRTGADAGPVAALEIDRLVVRYPSVLAVDEFSYSSPAGQVTALLGPNGAGKSSVLGAVSTAVPCESGTIRIFGRDIRHDAVAARAQLGLVFQERTLDKDLSVYRNLWFHARLFGMRSKESRQRIDAVLDRFGLADRRSDAVRNLSGGLARRVEVARSLLHGPGLLVLDEPTTGLDPEARAKVWDDLRRMRDELGVSILFSTHYMDEAEVADEIVIISDGRLVRRGSADQLKLGLARSSVLLRTQDDAVASANLVAAGWRVSSDSGALRVDCAEPEKSIAEIVGCAGTGVVEVRAVHPTMDDVYLSATRSGGAGPGGGDDELA
ncbi:MAG: ABC transporter ATP-binding protein [Saccharopolyspora sp.]|uniref:ABC transporter ATP-binding protein n=1 Tax=Saccharopolyspora sp. TaxID=33915 RepID=UPI0025EB7670|nr:ABC transporter ATP-binding protein [Saccharopolyspora sp.]MBQ6640377.1 ABC transporter ATP-binding protein [Saccharopolyspora sp.]